jgi:hypothetical protein
MCKGSFSLLEALRVNRGSKLDAGKDSSNYINLYFDLREILFLRFKGSINQAISRH